VHHQITEIKKHPAGSLSTLSEAKLATCCPEGLLDRI
jgi:hypothetical protein